MPRPLRVEYPNACYHVICRGNARLPVFQADSDKELLLDRMVHFAEIGNESKSEADPLYIAEKALAIRGIFQGLGYGKVV